MAKSWYQKGKKGRERSRQEDEAAKSRRSNDPWRFRLKNDESGKFVFLDNPNFFLHEHTLKVGPKRFVQETCIQDYDNCSPCDDVGDIASYVIVGSGIDTREWVDKDGKKRKNQKKLMVCKGKARQSLLRRIDQNDGDLKYCVFEFARGPNRNECATGEDIVFLKRFSKAQVKKLAPADEKDKEEWLEPFDYEEIFKPKTAEELRKIYGGAAPTGADDDDTGKDEEKEPDDDDTDTGSDFDEDALREELEEKNMKGLKKFIEENDLEVKVTSKMKDSTVINKIVAAMEEKGPEEPDEPDSEPEEEEEDLNIDDLI